MTGLIRRIAIRRYFQGAPARKMQRMPFNTSRGHGRHVDRDGREASVKVAPEWPLRVSCIYAVVEYRGLVDKGFTVPLRHF